ncbi:MAG: hypothetical protein WAK48_30260 [Candidatus Acidiferrum sp.]|jgi:hypothetical protein
MKASEDVVEIATYRLNAKQARQFGKWLEEYSDVAERLDKLTSHQNPGGSGSTIVLQLTTTDNTFEEVRMWLMSNEAIHPLDVAKETAA